MTKDQTAKPTSCNDVQAARRRLSSDRPVYPRDHEEEQTAMTAQLPRIIRTAVRECDGGPCPAIHELNSPSDDLGIQGFKAPDVAAEITDMPDTEDVVRVPRKLIEWYVVQYAEHFVQVLLKHIPAAKLLAMVNRYAAAEVR